jgi:hypothetical protein
MSTSDVARGVINEVIGEEFLENIEVSTALHFFGIAADDRFRALG